MGKSECEGREKRKEKCRKRGEKLLVAMPTLCAEK